MVTGYTLFKVYIPLKLHFTTKFDAFVYRNERLPSLAFEKYSSRSDCKEFDRWANHDGITKEKFGKVCIANFVYGRKDWLYQSKQEALYVYLQWAKIRSNIEEFFNHDNKILQEVAETTGRASIASLTEKTPKGNKPPLLQLLLAKKITTEFVCVLSRDHNFLDTWNTLYADDPLVNAYIHTVKKYAAFCKNFHLTEKEQ